MLKKVIGFTIGIVIIACMMTFTVMAQYDLGNVVWDQEGDPPGSWVAWTVASDNLLGSKPYDGKHLDLDVLSKAKNLYLEFNEEVELVDIILCGDGNGWGWTPSSFAVNGTSVSIPVADISAYSDFVAGTDGFLVLAKTGVSENISGLVKTAILLNDGETPPAAVAPETTVAEIAPAVADTTAAPEPAPVVASTPSVTTAPQTGDTTIMIFASVMMIAAVCVVILRKKITVK
ncbi:MAG: hypothetical protein FWD71_04950 [Oscillospiraceae bacterium]|nr:hypothetical protein [Oscillospiraceae bacterium]